MPLYVLLLQSVKKPKPNPNDPNPIRFQTTPPPLRLTLPHLLPAAFSPAKPQKSTTIHCPTTSAQSSTKRDPTAHNFFSFTRGRDRSSSPHQSALIFHPDLEGFRLNVEQLTAFPHPLGEEFENKVGFKSQFYPFPLQFEP
ncbi:hypothetical protein AABB24_030112 [Solanum stoloniferum]|uniref:Uncharacterized protein n=1 Tax=Solanum stoloniferum TaxID=62892 RepID=A0ABD2S138_9SOLN